MKPVANAVLVLESVAVAAILLSGPVLTLGETTNEPSLKALLTRYTPECRLIVGPLEKPWYIVAPSGQSVIAVGDHSMQDGPPIRTGASRDTAPYRSSRAMDFLAEQHLTVATAEQVVGVMQLLRAIKFDPEPWKVIYRAYPIDIGWVVDEHPDFSMTGPFSYGGPGPYEIVVDSTHHLIQLRNRRFDYFGDAGVYTNTISAAYEAEAQLATEVVAEKQTVRVGDPIRVSVSVTNQGPQELEVDGNGTAFNSFKVTDPDGQRLRYVGARGMMGRNVVAVPPFSTVSIAKALDLTDQYVFDKPGQYSVRLSGLVRGGSGASIRLPPYRTLYWLPSSSRDIAIEVTPGHLSELDQVVVALLRVCPNGGELQKAGAGEVVPSGRSKVPGFGAEMRGNHGEFVALWFTTAEAKLDPKSEVSGTSEYMGRMRGNFVYFALDGKTRTLWPTVTEDICRALQITK